MLLQRLQATPPMAVSQTPLWKDDSGLGAVSKDLSSCESDCHFSDHGAIFLHPLLRRGPDDGERSTRPHRNTRHPVHMGSTYHTLKSGHSSSSGVFFPSLEVPDDLLGLTRDRARTLLRMVFPNGTGTLGVLRARYNQEGRKLGGRSGSLPDSTPPPCV